MTFFDWFMAIVGFVNFACLIFWIACKTNPKVLKNEKIKKVFIFIEGYEPDELYETE